MQSQLSAFKHKYLTVHVLVPVLLVAALVYFVLPDWEVQQPPGALASQAPQLTPMDAAHPIGSDGYTLTPLADYVLTARVLARRHYYWGREADLAPVDLLLGWKQMSDTATLEHFNFHLSNRWYSWRARELPLPQDEIETELDNNHVMPANAVIERKLKDLRAGQVVHIEGLLVRIDGRDGYSWTSSLNIGSTGGPLSCKLIYALKLDVVR